MDIDLRELENYLEILLFFHLLVLFYFIKGPLIFKLKFDIPFF